MKRRARRATIVTAALVAVLVAVLVVANWITVRDHVEAWHFQLTRETKSFKLLSPLSEGDVLFGPAHEFEILATYSNRTVIFDAEQPDEGGLWTVHRGSTLTLGEILRVMREKGYRILEQRFPRRAYVLIRDAPAIPVMSETLVIPGSTSVTAGYHDSLRRKDPGPKSKQ